MFKVLDIAVFSVKVIRSILKTLNGFCHEKQPSRCCHFAQRTMTFTSMQSKWEKLHVLQKECREQNIYLRYTACISTMELGALTSWSLAYLQKVIEPKVIHRDIKQRFLLGH
ncbi:hypothetical protein ABKV19_022658 [Rosa sericea]